MRKILLILCFLLGCTTTQIKDSNIKANVTLATTTDLERWIDYKNPNAIEADATTIDANELINFFKLQANNDTNTKMDFKNITKDYWVLFLIKYKW